MITLTELQTLLLTNGYYCKKKLDNKISYQYSTAYTKEATITTNENYQPIKILLTFYVIMNNHFSKERNMGLEYPIMVDYVEMKLIEDKDSLVIEYKAFKENKDTFKFITNKEKELIAYQDTKGNYWDEELNTPYPFLNVKDILLDGITILGKNNLKEKALEGTKEMCDDHNEKMYYQEINEYKRNNPDYPHF